MNYQQIWQRQIDAGLLNHAYVLIGKYANKMTAAKWLVNELNCHQADAFYILGEKSISIGEVRELKRELSLAPYQSKYKVAIIYPADKLTVEAQNALLKLLEEPTKKSIILLLAESEESLLPTVLSRCQRIILPVEMEEITKKGEILPLDLLEGKWSVQEKFSWAEKIAGYSDLAGVMDSWLIQLRLQVEGGRKRNYVKLMGSIQEAKRMLQSNANNRLILENLMLEIGD